MIPHTQPDMTIRQISVLIERTRWAVFDKGLHVRTFDTEAEALRFIETGDSE